MLEVRGIASPLGEGRDRIVQSTALASCIAVRGENQRRNTKMSRIHLGVLLLMFAVIGWVAPRTSMAADTPETTEQIKQEVLRVSNEIDKAVATNDGDGLAANVSDELEYTQQTGVVLSKAEWQARMRSKKINTVVLKHDVSHVHIFNGDTVVLTGVSHSKVIFNGKVSNTPRKFTRTFVKQNGKWMLVAQHVTLVSEE
jgi:hypothetical protein